MKHVLLGIIIFNCISLHAMEPKKNLECEHVRYKNSDFKVYSITCPKGQSPYSSNAVPNHLCYNNVRKNIQTGTVIYSAVCARNFYDDSYPKPFVKK